MTQQSILPWTHRNLFLRTNCKPVLNISLQSPTKLQIGIWAVILIISLGISIRDYDSFQLGAYQDDAQYVLLARSLVNSKTYGLIDTIVQPAMAGFPFGFPLILAPITVWLPGHLGALKSVSLIATVVNTSLLFWGWRWFSHVTSYWWALATLGLYALSPLTISQTRMVMSEPVFTTFCLTALILIERIARDEHQWWHITLISVALLFAVLTRTIGLTLIASVFVFLIVVKRLGSIKDLILIVTQMAGLLYLITTLTPAHIADVFPAQYSKFLVPTEASAAPTESSAIPSYVLEDLAYRITRHFGIDVRDAVVPLFGGSVIEDLANRIGIPRLPIMIGFLLSALIGVGCWRWLISEKLSAFQIFLLFYAGVLGIWVWQETRFLYPVLPILFFAFMLGIEWALSAVARLSGRNLLFTRLTKIGPTILLMATVVSSLYLSLRIEHSSRHIGDIQLRTNWLVSHVPPDAIVMTEFPFTDSLSSARKTISYPFRFSTATDLIQYVSEYGVNYILVAPNLAWQSTYNPRYSRVILSVRPLIDDLVSRKLLTLVYFSSRDLVGIYQVN